MEEIGQEGEMAKEERMVEMAKEEEEERMVVEEGKEEIEGDKVD
jgi:hypothetical protein